MIIKSSLITLKAYLQISLFFLFVCSATFLSIDGLLKAEEEDVVEVQEGEEVAPPEPAATTAAQAPSVVATTDSEYADVRAEVKELKRTSGNTITLKFVIINDSAERLDFGYNFVEKDKGYGDIGGVHLIDAVGKKKYLVLRDSEGKCVCSTGMKSVEPGTRMNLFAKFPAPPESVEKISIIIPRFIPMDDVPISK
jgi:hypothetical protein